jgi:hypothetical protein
LKPLSKKLQTRLEEMEEAVKDDPVFLALMDEFTATLYTKGEVSVELQMKIHDHLDKRFPLINKGKRRKKKEDGPKQLNK